MPGTQYSSLGHWIYVCYTSLIVFHLQTQLMLHFMSSRDLLDRWGNGILWRFCLFPGQQRRLFYTKMCIFQWPPLFASTSSRRSSRISCVCHVFTLHLQELAFVRYLPPAATNRCLPHFFRQDVVSTVFTPLPHALCMCCMSCLTRSWGPFRTLGTDLETDFQQFGFGPGGFFLKLYMMEWFSWQC